MGDPENFNEARSIVTPVHIQPEWYFLFAYAILRCIPNKLGGVIALVCSIFILYLLPFSGSAKNIPSSFTPSYQITYWMLVSVFIILTWLGACPIEEPYITLAVPITIIYFLLYLILVLMPSFWLRIISDLK